jgi:glycerol-3-phosphate dehydrogenase (NAD(P)+)
MDGGRPARLEKVVVVGDGGWGSAISIHLARQGLRVGMWSYDSDYATHLREHRTNPRFLPGHPIPPAVDISSDLEALLDGADLLVSAVPTEFLRPVWSRHAPMLREGLGIVSLTKGLEQGTGLRPSQVLAQVTGKRPICVLSGPNIAWEIAKGWPAASVAAGDAALVASVRERFSNGSFRVYSNPDAVGVELGGALKNVIALGAGICDGMGLGQNAKATLLSRGVIEIARLGAALGGERRTFFGLSGMGDLMTTCYSATSRNRTFGERIGRGERPQDVIASTAQIAEGVKSAAPVHDLAAKHRLSLPISEEVYQVLHEGKEPRETVESLMRRGRKDESDDLA